MSTLTRRINERRKARQRLALACLGLIAVCWTIVVACAIGELESAVKQRQLLITIEGAR